MSEMQWISINDETPKFGQACIVAKYGEVLGFAQWGSEDIPIGGWVFIHATMYTAWFGESITHWMPMPEPPKETER